jgi:hypothetical protein
MTDIFSPEAVVGSWTIPADGEPQSHLIKSAARAAEGRIAIETRCGLDVEITAYGPVGSPACDNCTRDDVVDRAVASERDPVD